MTEVEFSAAYPDIDHEALYHACLYALKELHIAALKDAEDCPVSAVEHRAMAVRRLMGVLRWEGRAREEYMAVVLGRIEQVAIKKAEEGKE